ncbi:MAG: probable exported protein STY0357 [uncultured Sulfurovum sp.]|uniref:Probable exported protein STY0357 n=1 Tax=uncultured Sulfurovum sp. TaxID=269237 RepID=A0A6S6RUP8_9BACT|nr:MAG: probable exported protein STY0357 [uncultured Sulfurovum sp.]
MKNLVLHFLLFTILFLGLASLFYLYGKNIWYPYYKKYSYTEPKKQETLQPLTPCKECTLTHVGPLQAKIIEKECPPSKAPPVVEEVLTSKQRLKRNLADNDFVIYPKNLTLIGLKHEKILEVWTKKNGKYIHITDYPFTAFSGILGPKFKEGDRQIPEGIYGIGYLNPNSKFHLSMNINYPNAFDKKMAKKENRTNLGSAIMIHGSDKTVGCIPIGNDKIEELYFLAEKVGIKNIKVILAPVDFRKMEVNITKKNKHPWLKDLYSQIKKEMKPFISK